MEKGKIFTLPPSSSFFSLHDVIANVVVGVADVIVRHSSPPTAKHIVVETVVDAVVDAIAAAATHNVAIVAALVVGAPTVVIAVRIVDVSVGGRSPEALTRSLKLVAAHGGREIDTATRGTIAASNYSSFVVDSKFFHYQKDQIFFFLDAKNRNFL